MAIPDRRKLAEYGGEEIEEAVRHYRWGMASRSVLHQEGLERCFVAREGESCCSRGLCHECWPTYFVRSKGEFQGHGAIICPKNSENQPGLNANVKAGSR